MPGEPELLERAKIFAIEQRNPGGHHDAAALVAELVDALESATPALPEERAVVRAALDLCNNATEFDGPAGPRHEVEHDDWLALNEALDRQEEAEEPKATIALPDEEAVEPRFYLEHGMIHDRLTGKHVTTAPDDEPWNGGTISDCLALLNALSTSIAPGPDEPQAPTPFFSPDGVCNLLRAKCNGDQQAWAKANGLSPAYVSDVLNGRRDPADKILAALGLRRLSLVTFADMLDPQSLAAPLPDEEAVERAPFAPPPLNDRCPCHGSLWWECPDRVTDEVEEQDRRRALASIPSTEGGLRSAGHALAEAVAALISATDGNEELRPQRQAGVDAMRAFEAALAAAPKPSGGPDE